MKMKLLEYVSWKKMKNKL